MERILTENERMRRAEEIYLKRNHQNIHLVQNENRKVRTHIRSKILLYGLLLANIAILVFCIQNKDFIFTKEFLEQCAQYNVNLTEEFHKVVRNFLVDNTVNQNTTPNVVEENTVNQAEQTINQQENQNTVEQMQTQTENMQSSISQMDTDVENLKKSYHFVKPVTATISSVFGARESEYQNVTGYHTGIDLAAEKGTMIHAAMEGIVELVSSQGDYGQHIKIRCNNITTLYAHCSAIFVKEGQIVAEGQDIAQVGSTGNSTGNHLHFEIRVEDRFVDPAKIIEF